MASDRYDLVIRGGTVYDGTGGAGVRADVAVTGDRIAVVGAVAEGGATEIDAAGLAVSPGFIDVHSHDDFAVLMEPTMPFKVMQGVTSDVIGNCGSGVVPYRSAVARFGRLMPGAAPPEWDGFAGYLSRVDEAGPSLNVAVLIGHGSLRAGAMGLDQRKPSDDELGQMRGWVREGVEAGAVGLSTGLIYEPGRYAATDEIVALAREMGRDGGLYATHMRNEAAGLLDAVAEAIRIGEEGGVPVQISHHKAGGRDNWGRVRDSLALIEAARARGLDVTADQYPYTAGSTSFHAVVQNGAFRNDSPGGLGTLSADQVLIASAPRHPEYEGQRLAGLVERWGVPVDEAAARLLAEEGEACFVVVFSMDEADVRTVMAHPTTMIGSDGVPAAGSNPHPRLYGCFPRVLGHYVREERVLDLPTAIHRMTGMSATKFRLTDRGVVRPGAFADLVVFDPARIRDTATYEEPRRFPEGITAVYVNGTAVARDGQHTGARPGRALRRG
ncbi:MAG TPA: D-aminoacylase [Candidatus Limnocylindrales bacterium]|nr:D-aminoacylase [Candidatus Limnocylindrales bacterium]